MKNGVDRCTQGQEEVAIILFAKGLQERCASVEAGKKGRARSRVAPQWEVLEGGKGGLGDRRRCMR